jgi:acyl-CoA dehydrogenase
MTLLCDTTSLKEDIVGSADSILEFDPEAMTS